MIGRVDFRSFLVFQHEQDKYGVNLSFKGIKIEWFSIVNYCQYHMNYPWTAEVLEQLLDQFTGWELLDKAILIKKGA